MSVEQKVLETLVVASYSSGRRGKCQREPLWNGVVEQGEEEEEETKKNPKRHHHTATVTGSTRCPTGVWNSHVEIQFMLNCTPHALHTIVCLHYSADFRPFFLHFFGSKKRTKKPSVATTLLLLQLCHTIFLHLKDYNCHCVYVFMHDDNENHLRQQKKTHQPATNSTFALQFDLNTPRNHPFYHIRKLNHQPLPTTILKTSIKDHLLSQAILCCKKVSTKRI